MYLVIHQNSAKSLLTKKMGKMPTKSGNNPQLYDIDQLNLKEKYNDGTKEPEE